MGIINFMIKRTKNFFTAIYDERSILYELSKRDFQQQYMGSYLGFVWVFLQPLLFVMVEKSGPKDAPTKYGDRRSINYHSKYFRYFQRNQAR